MRLEEDLNTGNAGIVERKKLFRSHILFLINSIHNIWGLSN
jgi:hypothetical protein